MYVDILILASLWTGPRHGYEIRHAASAMLGGSCLLNNNQLYPLLKRFESDGVVVRANQAQAGRPERHVYTLAKRGKELLRERVADLPEAVARDDREFLIRVHFFHLIDARARRRILQTRMMVLHTRLERTAARMESFAGKKLPYAEQASRLITERTRLELEWIESLLKGKETGRPADGTSAVSAT